MLYFAWRISINMGLLDIAESLIGGSLSGGTIGTGQPGGLSTQSVLGTVLGALNNHPGGLGGVVDTLSKNGLQDVVASWIGNGPNPPVTADQVQGALGSEAVTNITSEIAGKLGISPDAAGTVLTQVLPHLVDHLTPNGQVPQGGLSGAGSSLLGSLLGGSLGASLGMGR